MEHRKLKVVTVKSCAPMGGHGASMTQQCRDTFVDARSHLHLYLCTNVPKVAIGAAGGSLVLVLLLLVRTSFHMRVSDRAQRG